MRRRRVSRLNGHTAYAHSGFLQLNRIREQFEAEEAENKCKLERLNG